MSNLTKWNIEESGGRLRACKGDHDNGHSCEFEPLTLADVGLFRRRIIDLERQNALLRAVALVMQWQPDGFLDSCSLCNQDKDSGHDADCLYQVAIDGDALEKDGE